MYTFTRRWLSPDFAAESKASDMDAAAGTIVRGLDVLRCDRCPHGGVSCQSSRYQTRPSNGCAAASNPRAEQVPTRANREFNAVCYGAQAKMQQHRDTWKGGERQDVCSSTSWWTLRMMVLSPEDFAVLGRDVWHALDVEH